MYIEKSLVFNCCSQTFFEPRSVEDGKFYLANYTDGLMATPYNWINASLDFAFFPPCTDRNKMMKMMKKFAPVEPNTWTKCPILNVYCKVTGICIYIYKFVFATSHI